MFSLQMLSSAGAGGLEIAQNTANYDTSDSGASSTLGRPSFPGKLPTGRCAGSRVGRKQLQSGAFRHCKPAACILGLIGANMRLSIWAVARWERPFAHWTTSTSVLPHVAEFCPIGSSEFPDMRLSLICRFPCWPGRRLNTWHMLQNSLPRQRHAAQRSGDQVAATKSRAAENDNKICGFPWCSEVVVIVIVNSNSNAVIQ